MRLKTTAIYLLILLTAVALAQPGQMIVGSWVQDSQNSHWTFRPDGTGVWERQEPKGMARFNWQLQGSTLQVTTAGTLIPYQVVRCDGQNLVIKNDRIARTYELRRQ